MTWRGEFDGHDAALLYPGSIVGARSWLVDDDGWLTGVFHRALWSPGVTKAECRRTYTLPVIPDPRSHVGPLPTTSRTTRRRVTGPARPFRGHDIEECQCGLYAYFEGSSDYRTESPVSGIVRLYGLTIHGTRGARAEYGEILALCIGANEEDVPGWTRDHGAQVAYYNPRAWLPFVTGRSRFSPAKPLPWLLKRKLRRNYPGVPFFDSFAEMVAAYPTTPPPPPGEKP